MPVRPLPVCLYHLVVDKQPNGKGEQGRGAERATGRLGLLWQGDGWGGWWAIMDRGIDPLSTRLGLDDWSPTCPGRLRGRQRRAGEAGLRVGRS